MTLDTTDEIVVHALEIAAQLSINSHPELQRFIENASICQARVGNCSFSYDVYSTKFINGTPYLIEFAIEFGMPRQKMLLHIVINESNRGYIDGETEAYDVSLGFLDPVYELFHAEPDL